MKKTHSEKMDAAVEVISSTTAGFAAICPEQCQLPGWSSPHCGTSVDMGIYDSSPALPSRILDMRLAGLMVPMAVEVSTLSTSNELAGSGPVNAVQSIRNAGHSAPSQLRPSTSSNCVFPADCSVLPGPVLAEVVSVDRAELSKPMAGAIDTIDGVPLANLPLAPPQSVVCDGKLIDDDYGSIFVPPILDKRASAHENGINCQPGATMWSSQRPCLVNHQHQHQEMKQAISTIPSRAISISTHVTDQHLVYPRRGTSLPDLAWLPPLARTEMATTASTSPLWFESTGADIACTSRDSRNFHPSPSISTSFSASLFLSSSSLLFSIPSVFILSAAVILCPSAISSESLDRKTRGRACDSLLQDRKDVIRNPAESSIYKLGFTRTLYTPLSSDALSSSKLITRSTPTSE